MDVLGALLSIFYSSDETLESRMNTSFSNSSQFLSSSSSSSSSHVSNRDTNFAQRAGRLIHVIITCIIAAVGSSVGAVTGGLIGLATESGPLRGAGIGAISGAVFSIEAFESSIAIWHSNESGIWSVLYVVDIICSLLSGRLVREKVGPAMRSAVQSQMSAVDSPFMEAIDIFDTGGTKGLTEESVDKIPQISINCQNIVDDMGERLFCVVCLQDFEIGETVRCLPYCQHKFHLPCIDGWLIRHASCPLCRRDL
ncbi:uncharacterized protein A4U43_C07F24450 [Asparagus officinalis]|uniref:RING-type domain-containing protein n=1 Tax=Asparagus officinalis TaxID=4686 RepID=A0A5P1EHJ5_ASPOF|nr:NEP1-interacting protein 1-like [Asparagus officinalis]ONK64319.1 uncharacterized protein A4U43_C07F24450 [Asparagus officinalis]